MASTTADTTLVEGAYAAAGGNIKDYGLAAAKGLTEIGKDVGDKTADILKERRDRFEKFADNELARQPGTLPHAEYEALEKDLNRRRRRFVWLGKKDRQMLMRELETEQEEQLKLDETKQKISNQAKNGDKGLTDDFVNGEGTDILNEIENGNIETNSDGEKGVFVNKDKPCDGTFDDCFKQNRDMNIQQHGMDFSKWTNFLWSGEKTGGEVRPFHPYQQDDLDGKTHTTAAVLGQSQPYGGQWKSLSDINKSIDENSYDNVSNDVINGSIEETMQRSSSVMPGENGVFNYDSEKRKYKNIVNKGNIKSLTTQEFVPGRTFKGDLVEMLENNTYESLGVKGRKVKRFDPTPDTPVTPEDAQVIAEKLMSNERLTKKYLTTYFTNYAEQNWIQAAKSRKTDEQGAPAPTSSNSNKPPANDGGGGNNEDVYGDHDTVYDYKVVEGKWHTRKKGSEGDWIDISGDEYKSSVDKLNKKYPDAISNKGAILWTPEKKDTTWTGTNDVVSTSGGSLYQGKPVGFGGAMK